MIDFSTWNRAALEDFARDAEEKIAAFNRPVPLSEWQKMEAELTARSEVCGAPFISRTLARLRAERDRQIGDHEIRKAYNAACDRLDVLHSRIVEANNNKGANSGASHSDEKLDAERWRFCLKYGFPLHGPQWVQRQPNGLYVCGGTPSEAVDRAMATN